MQLLVDSDDWTTVPAFVVGVLVNEAARKLLMKKTRAITTIMKSSRRDLLLVALITTDNVASG
jgi:hypothetical protein